MDINLGPGIDGTQAAEQILNKKDIPVVFLSSHTEPEVVEKQAVLGGRNMTDETKAMKNTVPSAVYR